MKQFISHVSIVLYCDILYFYFVILWSENEMDKEKQLYTTDFSVHVV